MTSKLEEEGGGGIKALVVRPLKNNFFAASLMKYARITIHTKIIYRSNIILLSVADFVSVTGSQMNQETRLVIFPHI